MKNWKDFQAKEELAVVGDERLIVREFSVRARDELMSMIDLEKFNSVMGNLRDEEKDTISKAIESENLTPLMSMIQTVFSGALSKAVCLALDTKPNREKLEMDSVFDWVMDNLTIRQELELIKLVIEVNDFFGLIGSYASLLSNLAPKDQEDS